MKRIHTKFGLDLTVCAFTTSIAYLLRVEGAWSSHAESVLWISLLVLPLKAAVIWLDRLYLQSWHKVGLRDLFTITRGVATYTFVFLGIAFLFQDMLFIPFSVPVIEAMLLILGLGGIRLACRLWYEFKYHKVPGLEKGSKRVLIAGAGEAGTMIAREMLRHPETKMNPVGFLDDDQSKQMQRFLGLHVLGGTREVSEIISRYEIDVLLIAMPSESGECIRQIIDAARGADVEYKTIPALYELLSGRVTINQVRDVNVEDLLRREPIQLNMGEIANYLNERTVLVTGAGGSIGSEIVRQITNFEPSRIILLDHCEFNIYKIQQELSEFYPENKYELVVADVRDKSILRSVFEKYYPQVIFHAAAHKHVPLMEENPEQAILNNVGGTKNLVDLALEYGVKHFVNISTDKAVNPTSVMGASKRVAEYTVEDASRKADASQVFVSVRFGNVLGSRGSVVPKFKEQIKKGQPITVTHPEMTRYFMTIPEAAQLVLQAGGLEESGAVYVLDMGEPVKIMDLANDLIRLSGLEPNVDIPIKITGMRPGEKLYEELLTSEENTSVTKYNKIHVAKQRGIPDNFEADLERLIRFSADYDREQLHVVLDRLIEKNELAVSRLVAS